MRKCGICMFGSWVVGLVAVAASLFGILSYPLPAGTLAGALYVVVLVVAISFLYYQIVPCPRCARKQKGSE